MMTMHQAKIPNRVMGACLFVLVLESNQQLSTQQEEIQSNSQGWRGHRLQGGLNYSTFLTQYNFLLYYSTLITQQTSKNLLLQLDGDYYRQSQLVKMQIISEYGILFPMDISTMQFLLQSLSKHWRGRSRKIVRASVQRCLLLVSSSQGSYFSVISPISCFTQDLRTDNINGHCTVNGKCFTRFRFQMRRYRTSITTERRRIKFFRFLKEQACLLNRKWSGINTYSITAKWRLGIL